MFKKILSGCIFVLCCSSLAIADTKVDFACDANKESDLAGYRVYQSDISNGQVRVADGGSAVLTFIPSGANEETWTLTIPDGQWFWKVTAFDFSNNESILSDEVSLIADSTPPGGVGGFRITATAIVP